MPSRLQDMQQGSVGCGAPPIDLTSDETHETLLEQLRTQNVALERLLVALDVEDLRDASEQRVLAG